MDRRREGRSAGAAHREDRTGDRSAAGIWRAVLPAAAEVVNRHGWSRTIDALERAVQNRATGDSAVDSAVLGPLLRAAERAAGGLAAGAVIPLALGTSALAVRTAAPCRYAAGLAEPEVDLSPGLAIPARRTPAGPVTRQIKRRARRLLAAVEAAGLVTVVVGRSPRSRAFGLGVMAPGAGLVYTGQPVLFALGLAAFAVALLLLIATGNFLLPPLVWGGLAALAARQATRRAVWAPARVAVPAVLAAVPPALALIGRRNFRVAQETASRRNEFLIRANPQPLDTGHVVGPELSEVELALARHLLDLALQPKESFEGFDIIEQFQASSVRYQIHHTVSSLAALASTRTPAFAGYLHDGLRRLVEKNEVRKCWTYWAVENVWGNLKFDPDPIKYQNIMFSGYLAQQLGFYETVTGDTRFDAPGAMEFVWSKRRRYRYGYGEICDAMSDNWRKSPFLLFECEPNFAYIFCNNIGLAGALMHDRMHGSTYWDEFGDLYRRAVLEEFTRADGALEFIRSMRMGFSLPVKGLAVDASTAVQLRPLLPDVAERSWLILREELLSRKNGRLELHLVPPFDNTDAANYSNGPIFAHASLLWAARELGDDELAEQTWELLESAFPPEIRNGALVFPGSSIVAHNFIALGLFSRTGTWLNLVRNGLPKAWLEGPVLDTHDYQRVAVARAVTDGDALDLVLRPVSIGGRVELDLARLVPHRPYSVAGAVEESVTAGPDGRARITVDLDGRREVRVAPQA